jgi:hypothetical protein
MLKNIRFSLAKHSVVRSTSLAIILGFATIPYSSHLTYAEPDTLVAGVPTPAVDSVTGARLAQWDCPAENVCFWTGFSGTGSRCRWNGTDNDWTSGRAVCSWALSNNVRSIWNRNSNPERTGVRYYLSPNFNNSVGCTRQSQRGNLQGTYKIRSHRFITGSCG